MEYFYERVRYYRTNGGDWKAEVEYAAKVLGQDPLDVLANSLGGFTQDDVDGAYEDGKQDGFEDGWDGGYSIGHDDGYDEGHADGLETGEINAREGVTQ